MTQDHDDTPYEYEGDAVQIVCVYGEPPVTRLEQWNAGTRQWDTTWAHAGPEDDAAQ